MAKPEYIQTIGNGIGSKLLDISKTDTDGLKVHFLLFFDGESFYRNVKLVQILIHICNDTFLSNKTSHKNHQ